MQRAVFVRAAAVWLCIALLAVGNGVVRELLLAPLFGKGVALSLSGLVLVLVVFAVSWVSISFLAADSRAAYWLIGAQWVCMTLTFEFLFGHFVVGKPWSALLQTFNVASGDLFVLVLIASFLSPYTAARLQGFS